MQLQEKKLIEEFCNFIEKKGGKIIFLPHSMHNDDSLANDYEFMKSFMKDGRRILESLGEVYAWYKSPDSLESGREKICITMRLHSILLSYVYGIDQVALSYSQKTDELIKKITS